VIRLTKLDPTTSAASAVLIDPGDISRVETDNLDPSHRTMIVFKSTGAEIYVEESVEDVERLVNDARSTQAS
jgi:hypothetical protein